jgi:hypothetical protein
MSRDYEEARMSYDTPPEPAKQVQQAAQTSQDLLSRCQADSEHIEVVVAVREFPDSEYSFFYSKHEITIAQTKMIMLGYAVDTKTVMDSKCSKLILLIDKDIVRQRVVHAEKLPEKVEGK